MKYYTKEQFIRAAQLADVNVTYAYLICSVLEDDEGIELLEILKEQKEHLEQQLRIESLPKGGIVKKGEKNWRDANPE